MQLLGFLKSIYNSRYNNTTKEKQKLKYTLECAGPSLCVSQENNRMAKNCNEQHPDIKRHERQHHQVIQTHSHRVQSSTCQLSNRALPPGPNEAAMA